jgi:alpha-N-arabinofuranosidase
MPLAAGIHLDSHFTVGEVNPRVFGSFVEHLGRCVYTGIYEPGHPTAGADGLRRDVLDLVRELGVTVVRYPGGNFVSGFRWEDSIGPAELRPRRLDPAWRTVETNQFGLAEFMTFARAAGVEPMMAVNLGTRGITEAGELLEYANHPGGTALSELRRAHAKATGSDGEPFDIRLWCLGNEMDGPWQMGHKTADEYGRLAAETARMMRLIDDRVQLVVCGSSNAAMPTFGEWEATVLGHTYDVVDHISLHAYYDPHSHDLDSFLASAQDMELFIDGVVATCDAVRARLRSSKVMQLSFDEWNVWSMSRMTPSMGDWQEAPRLLEDVYTAADAVVVGSLLITLLRHCDRVTAACLAQLVNVIAPIMTEPGGPAWRQTIFHPFAQAARYGRGQVLQLAVQSPSHHTARFGTVDLLHTTAVRAEDGWLTIFAVNRSAAEPIEVTVDLGDVVATGPATHMVLTDADPLAVNTAAAPDRVAPVVRPPIAVDGRHLRVELPAMSWNTLRIPLVG